MPTILITGGHAGIGLEASRYLAREARADLVLAGRDLGRVEQAAAALRAEYGVSERAVALDLVSLASVRQAAEALRELGPFQAILCNAGAQFQGAPSFSPDGYEETFAVNCLGHFLLVHLLLDRVAPDGRIVFTASGTHDPATMDGKVVGAAAEPDAKALAAGDPPLSGGRRYSTSKLCNILHAYELARRLKLAGARVEAIAFDPGFIPETGLARAVPAPFQAIARSGPAKWLFRQLGVTMGGLEFSGAALGRLAVDAAFADASGQYWQSKDGVLSQATSSKASYDEAKAARLWTDSETLVHLEPARRLLAPASA